MLEIFFLGLLFLFVAYGFCYAVLYLPSELLLPKDQLKKTRRILAFICGVLIVSFYLFYSPTDNNDTATIRRDQSQYIITLTGKRLLMVHDPFSALLRETYVDTFKLAIPPKKGIINGVDISTESGIKVSGTLNITEDRLKVELFINNKARKTRTPLDWNDNYKIQWLK